MKSASLPVTLLTEIEGDPSEVLSSMFPGKSEMLILKQDAQFDLWITLGEEKPLLILEDLGQHFYVPDVLDPPRELDIPRDFALEMLTTAIRASK